MGLRSFFGIKQKEEPTMQPTLPPVTTPSKLPESSAEVQPQATLAPTAAPATPQTQPQATPTPTAQEPKKAPEIKTLDVSSPSSADDNKAHPLRPEHRPHAFVIMPFVERDPKHSTGFFAEVLRSLIARKLLGPLK